MKFEPARPLDTDAMPWMPTGPVYLAWCREHGVEPAAQILG